MSVRNSVAWMAPFRWRLLLWANNPGRRGSLLIKPVALRIPLWLEVTVSVFAATDCGQTGKHAWGLNCAFYMGSHFLPSSHYVDKQCGNTKNWGATLVFWKSWDKSTFKYDIYSAKFENATYSYPRLDQESFKDVSSCIKNSWVYIKNA